MKHLVTTSILAALLPLSASFAAEVDLQNAFPNLPYFDFPTDLQDPMDGTDRLFMLEKAGKIWVFQNDPSVSSRKLFLDLSPYVNSYWECGLLGLAFDPNYDSTGAFYVYYTADAPLTSRLSRFHVSGDPDVADLGSEEILLEIPQTNFCHKSGCLVFGPDGYLYLTVGDDCQGWPAQDRTSLMGKMLRLDVNGISLLPYAIPRDNPFVGNTHGWREEIYAYGFRNTWRFSIDPETKRIWGGDVGEASWEEVNIIKKGRNYGWWPMEGNECYHPPECDTTGTNNVLPVWVFPHVSELGESITGGFVYRGHTCPSLWGKYVYCDYVNGTMWALSYDGVTATNDEIYNVGVRPFNYLSTFGVDKDDEVYVVTLWGYIYKMVDLTTGVANRTPPATALRVQPNPFQTSTMLQFDVPASSGDARIDLYDVSGRRVRALISSASSSARMVTWNGTDDHGRELASGVYFARLTIDGRDVGHQRVVLVR
jgi:hypothetical protein